MKSEDYYKDRIVSDESSIYPGFSEIEVSDPGIVSDFYSNGRLDSQRLPIGLFPNQYVAVKCESQSFLGVNSGGSILPLSCKLHSTISVSPKNKEQKFALDLLTRDDIPLATITGLAGSGKTFLTLMAGLAGIASKKYERIVITRSMQTVGKDIGYLPGSVKEKMEPWIGPIADNFRYAFKDISYFQMMQDKGIVELCPLSFIRGRTFSNTFIIVDEAQNTTIHELKTVVTRAGEGSKIVLLGDIEQIDTPYIDSLSNGLTIVVEKFKTEHLAGHMTLNKGERSNLATVASRIL
jgi:PhoH-like ATPase